MKSIAPFSALAMSLALPVFAQSFDENGQGMGACFKLAEGEEADCVIGIFEARDEELNIVYGAVLEIDAPVGESAGVHIERLRAAQRSWVQFRDLACLSEAGPPLELPAINFEHYFCLDRLTGHGVKDPMRLGALNE
ncbi:DUF1311 domain-containing protein [Octadecabacter sp.]|nr:DUF1311 domain-containing protein [Octadecabacter sp.]